MSRLPALVDALAAHDQRPRTYLDYYARNLRKGDYIASDRPGAGSASVTFRDAARLLMATSGAVSASDTLEVMKTLTTLERTTSFDPSDAAPTFSGLRALTSFEATLEALIEAAPSLQRWEQGYLDRWRKQAARVPGPTFEAEPPPWEQNEVAAPMRSGVSRLVKIVTYAPGVAAEIHFGRPWLPGEPDTYHAFFLAREQPGAISSNQSLISTEVGLTTLLALHDVVRAPTRYPRQKTLSSSPTLL